MPLAAPDHASPYAMPASTILGLLQQAEDSPAALPPPAQLSQAARRHLIETGQRLLTDAQAFFASPLPAPPIAETRQLDPDAPLEIILQHMLQQREGLVISASPTAGAERRLLIEQMPRFKHYGIHTLYIEALLSDAHQSHLDHYLDSSASRAPPPELSHYLQQASSFNWLMLLQQAKQHGIRVVALDCMARKYLEAYPELLQTEVAQHTREYFEHQGFNFIAQQMIRSQQSIEGSGRWLALLAPQRASRFQQIPGVAELTRGLSLRINTPSSRRTPRFTQQDSGTLFQTGAGAEWAWLKADWLLSNRPEASGVELNTLLRTYSSALSSRFLLRTGRAADTLELRYCRGNEVIRRTVRAAPDQGYLIENRNPIRREITQTRFASLSELVNFFARQRCIPLELPSQPAWSIHDAQQRQQQTRQFAQRRHEVLWHMSWFASAEERAEFRQGRNSFRQEQAGQEVDLSDLSALNLAGADLSELKQAFIDSISPWHQEQLSPRQQGALLSAIHWYQAQALALHITRWQTLITAQGAERILIIAHNSFLAATDQPKGLCSALAAQVAAAWMQERDQAPIAFQLDHSLQRLAAATTAPGIPEAQVLGLGLLEWAFVTDSAKFGRFAAQPFHDLGAAAQRVISSEHSSAYQLSLGDHAICIGVLINRQHQQRRYFLADPNYGYAEFASEQLFEQGLQFQENYWRRLFPGEQEDRVFMAGYSLRQYRDDLPDQPLFVQRASPTPLQAELTLGDLGSEAPLARRFPALEHNPRFKALQQRLTLTEYRARMLPLSPSGLPLNQRLQQIFMRHSGRDDLMHLRNITFYGPHALMQFQRAPTSAMEELTINGRHYAEDLQYLRQYQAFWLRLTRANRPGGIGLDLDSLFLSTALPDDSPTTVDSFF